MALHGEFEAGFAAALREPGGAPEGLHDPPGGVAGRFRVYRNNVAASLAGALAATYPAVQALVGPEFFRGTAREFTRRHPPRSPVLIEYGEGFPAFLAEFPPAGSVPYLADVARLEWAWLRAFHAADAEPARAQMLAGLPPAALLATRLRPHPSAHCLASAFPIVSLWREVTGRAPQTALDLGRGETALILRPAYEVQVERLEPPQARLAQGILAGRSLGEIAETFAGEDLGRALAWVFGLGLVAGLA
ncbi:MAG TPA: DNA-binding domain-containing protein [Paracoccaceae bacterium]|nr:DNA-binding domain-containing protein [Paracoccaceae bacterium]